MCDGAVNNVSDHDDGECRDQKGNNGCEDKGISLRRCSLHDSGVDLIRYLCDLRPRCLYSITVTICLFYVCLISIIKGASLCISTDGPELLKLFYCCLLIGNNFCAWVIV